MSLTLGEKLKQARESRGITISEVAEQTRISSLYLESIENNDYRGLPGGIFNKGFVKSYAKYVGINEQDALQDYAQLIAEQGESNVEETKTYRPEVLTDDRNTSSMIPTLLFAVVILGLLAWGVFTLLSYYRDYQNQPIVANTASNSNKATNTGNSNVATNVTIPSVMPAGEMNIQFKSLSTEAQKPNLTTWIDGSYESFTFQGDEVKTFTPKQSLKVIYSKYQTANLQLTINGKPITLPTPNPKKNGVEFEINKANIQQIWQSGAITLGTPAPPNANTANTNTANTAPR